MILGTQGGVQSENSEQLEFADPLNENAMFLKPQGFQNEVKIVPKRAERRKKSREEAKREQRSAKRALESVLGALWGASRGRTEREKTRTSPAELRNLEKCVSLGGGPRESDVPYSISEGRWSARTGYKPSA